MRECSWSQATLQPLQHWRRVVSSAIVHPNCVGFLFERCNSTSTLGLRFTQKQLRRYFKLAPCRLYP
jgi:hypothetical protein